MTLIYPAYVLRAFRAARLMQEFMKKTGFSSRAVPPFLATRDREEVLALYRREGGGGGLAHALREAMQEVYVSPAFDRHVKRQEGGPVSVPRLNRLIGRDETTEMRREHVVVAFAQSLVDEKGRLAENVEDLVEHFFKSDLFADAEWKNPYLQAATLLFELAPTLAFRLVEMPERLDPDFVMCLRYGVVRYFLLNRYFEKATELCQAFFEQADDQHPLIADYLDQFWYTRFRMGDLAGAQAALDRWIGQRPQNKRPLVCKAVTTAVIDREKALGLLHASGASLGESTTGGNVLYAEYAMRLGRVDDAELAIRRALVAAPEDTAATYLFTLHNILLMRGIQSRALVPVFRRSGLRLSWDTFGIDTIVDRTPDFNVKGEPKVTIVMTAFNAGTYLERAARSVLDQSYANLELIIVDDKSSDGTPDICRMLEVDPRVRVMRNAVNIGTYASKNIGIAAATGDYVALCDSDDAWLRSHVAEHLRAMWDEPDLMLTTSQWVRVQTDGSVECGMRGGYVETCPHSTFFRREVFEKVGYFDSVRFGADREFVNRVQLHYGASGRRLIRKILTLGRRHDQSLTTSGAGAISEFNESPIRMEYWRNWNEWQLAELTQQRLPKIPLGPAPRLFPAPPPMEVHFEAPAPAAADPLA